MRNATVVHPRIIPVWSLNRRNYLSKRAGTGSATFPTLFTLLLKAYQTNGDRKMKCITDVQRRRTCYCTYKNWSNWVNKRKDAKWFFNKKNVWPNILRVHWKQWTIPSVLFTHLKSQAMMMMASISSNCKQCQKWTKEFANFSLGRRIAQEVNVLNGANS